MKKSLRRLRIVAIVSFFPLAIIGWGKEKTSLRQSLMFYYTSILIFSVFLMLLSIYTYTRGGSFIAPLGTFY